MRVITPEHRCLPFVLVFFGDDQSTLALAAAIILSVLLFILGIGLVVAGFDTGMFKRNPPAARGDDVASAIIYVDEKRKENPDRKLIYYGVPLFLQYVH